jgi:hypothetical protein
VLFCVLVAELSGTSCDTQENIATTPSYRQQIKTLLLTTRIKRVCKFSSVRAKKPIK